MSLGLSPLAAKNTIADKVVTHQNLQLRLFSAIRWMTLWSMPKWECTEGVLKSKDKGRLIREWS